MSRLFVAWERNVVARFFGITGMNEEPGLVMVIVDGDGASWHAGQLTRLDVSVSIDMRLRSRCCECSVKIIDGLVEIPECCLGGRILDKRLEFGQGDVGCVAVNPNGRGMGGHR
jgi:hypothetical protein